MESPNISSFYFCFISSTEEMKKPLDQFKLIFQMCLLPKQKQITTISVRFNCFHSRKTPFLHRGMKQKKKC